MSGDLSKRCKRESCAFEKKNGAIGLMKVVLNAMSKILVGKGVCTEDELRRAFLDVLEQRK